MIKTLQIPPKKEEYLIILTTIFFTKLGRNVMSKYENFMDVCVCIMIVLIPDSSYCVFKFIV